MKFWTVSIASLFAAGFLQVHDQVRAQGKWQPTAISHNQVQPFPERPATTISEKAALAFKPQLKVASGCVPYPVVNDKGEVSDGLRNSGKAAGSCRGSGYGSQVYSRSTWMADKWAIMYMWYFPKNAPESGRGHRHGFEHVVVFVNNPGTEEPQIIGCSTSKDHRYAPCPAHALTGKHLKVMYAKATESTHAVNITSEEGVFQDMITWEQMPDVARRALNEAINFYLEVPINDQFFMAKVSEASPF
ncbi:hypothetical protein CCR75_008895 [Bremia lactucae]|uniref:Uncharacterized protein n=1 Tax=Bremia lactucae TaxID=4779 RepID=A0A976NZK2_BRELC|nr:hypothetical protein CCR75_008895 [Bremia lactucae]